MFRELWTTHWQESEANIGEIDRQGLVLGSKGALLCQDAFWGEFFWKLTMKGHMLLIPVKKYQMLNFSTLLNTISLKSQNKLLHYIDHEST